MDTDKKLQTKLDDKECDIVTGFATYLMQKQQDEIDELKAEIKRLEKENVHLLKACKEQFTFNTTTNKKFSIFNLARKEFAEKLKEIIHERDYVQGYAEIGLIEEIDELLKEYEGSSKKSPTSSK